MDDPLEPSPAAEPAPSVEPSTKIVYRRRPEMLTERVGALEVRQDHVEDDVRVLFRDSRAAGARECERNLAVAEALAGLQAAVGEMRAALAELREDRIAERRSKSAILNAWGPPLVGMLVTALLAGGAMWWAISGAQ